MFGEKEGEERRGEEGQANGFVLAGADSGLAALGGSCCSCSSCRTQLAQLATAKQNRPSSLKMRWKLEPTVFLGCYRRPRHQSGRVLAPTELLQVPMEGQRGNTRRRHSIANCPYTVGALGVGSSRRGIHKYLRTRRFLDSPETLKPALSFHRCGAQNRPRPHAALPQQLHCAQLVLFWLLPLPPLY